MAERRVQSNGWLYDQMQVIRQEQIEAHRRLREDMMKEFEKLHGALDDHTAEDRLVADRVLKIEIGLEGAKQTAARKAALMSLVIAAGFSAVLKIIEHWWQTPVLKP